MITYEFCITKFNLTVKDQGTTWVVRDIGWIYSGVNQNGVYASVEGNARLDYTPEQTTFIPVDQITNTHLATWLFEKLGSPFLQHLKDSIDGTIERNALIAQDEMAMTTWLPLPAPAVTPVEQELLDAYLSG